MKHLCSMLICAGVAGTAWAGSQSCDWPYPDGTEATTLHISLTSAAEVQGPVISENEGYLYFGTVRDAPYQWDVMMQGGCFCNLGSDSYCHSLWIGTGPYRIESYWTDCAGGDGLGAEFPVTYVEVHTNSPLPHTAQRNIMGYRRRHYDGEEYLDTSCGLIVRQLPWVEPQTNLYRATITSDHLTRGSVEILHVEAEPYWEWEALDNPNPTVSGSTLPEGTYAVFDHGIYEHIDQRALCIRGNLNISGTYRIDFSATNFVFGITTSVYVQVENQFMAVQQVTPTNGTTGVFWEEPDITATLNYPLSLGSLSRTTFRVRYEDGTDIPGTLAVEDRTIRFTPIAPLDDYGRNIRVTLAGGSSGIRGTNNYTMVSNYTWSFTTMPTVTVQVIPCQVVDGVDWVQGKESVIRVKAVWGGGNNRLPGGNVHTLSARTEVAYDGAPPVSLGDYVFHRVDDMNARKATLIDYAKMISGNSANYFSRDNQVPIYNSVGAHEIAGKVVVRDHRGVDREFTGTTNVTVRSFSLPWTSAYNGYRLLYVPIDVGGWQAGESRDISHLAAESSAHFKNMFPVPAVKPRAKDRVWGVAHGAEPPGIVSAKWLEGLTVSLSRYSYFTRDVIIGVAPAALLSRAAQVEGLGGGVASMSVGSVLLADNAGPLIAAHEIGHIVEFHNLTDIFGWFAHSDAGLNQFAGFDLMDRTLVDTARLNRPSVDLMSAGISGTPAESVWVAPSTYNRFLNQMTDSPGWFRRKVQSAGADMCVVDILLISSNSIVTGNIDGVLTLADAPASSNNPAGTYRVALLNELGQEIRACRFEPSFVLDADNTQFTYQRVVLSLDAETRWVALFHHEQELARLARSADFPAVQVTHPAAGTVVTNDITVRWSVTDPDGGEPNSSLYFSDDGGGDWTPLVVNLAGTNQLLEVSQLSSTTQGMIKVVVSDGFNQTEAVSGRFAVERNPGISWVSPAPGARQVSAWSSVRILFSDPVSPGSLTTNQFSLWSQDGAAVPCRRNYEPDRCLVTLTPEQPLALATLHTARVSAAVMSSSGLTLGSEYAWSFMAEDGSAPPTVTITAPNPGFTCRPGASVLVQATFTPGEGRMVTNAFLLADGIPVATNNAEPYHFSWTPAAPGAYEMVVVAFDNEDMSDDSDPRQVVVAESTGVIANLAPHSFVFNPAILQVGAHPTQMVFHIQNLGPDALASNVFLNADIYISRNDVFGDADDQLMGSPGLSFSPDSMLAGDDFWWTIRSGLTNITVPNLEYGQYRIFCRARIRDPLRATDPYPANDATPRASPVTVYDPAQQVKLLDNYNAEYALNEPPLRPVFTCAVPHAITYATTYHINGGFGATPPGTIALRNQASGQVHGPWLSWGGAGPGGVPLNAYWYIVPWYTIPAGVYELVDGQPSTWAYNATSGNTGIGSVWGIPLPNAANTDSDGDGIPDEWENRQGLNAAVSNALHANSDGDWATDFEEFVADTHPTNPHSYFLPLTWTGTVAGKMNLIVEPTSTARVYGILWNTNLVVLPQNWQLIGPEQTGSGSTITFSITNDQNMRLYRSRVRLP